MSDRYILEGKFAVLCDGLTEWGRWFEANGETRRVGHDTVVDARVSTVFLGSDHSFGDGPPLLFETMVFDGPHDGFQDRYTTWDQAEAGHKNVVLALREGRDPNEPQQAVSVGTPDKAGIE